MSLSSEIRRLRLSVTSNRLKPGEGSQAPTPKRAPFLRGPIPWAWLQAAARSPRVLKVGLALWHYRSLRKSTSFRVGLGDLAALWGMSSQTASRGLKGLEELGLVQVVRPSGRKPTITLVPEASGLQDHHADTDAEREPKGAAEP